MLKRKASMVKKAPESRPRKKQAVTKTSKSATIALIRQNATNSPLLSLPPEVRERILKHLLGDKLIHIRYLNEREEIDYNTIHGVVKRNDDKKGSFRNTICSALGAFDFQREALGDSERHQDCKLYSKREFSRQPAATIPVDLQRPMKNALTVLSVCRQLYEESNFILWSTNTFSFDYGPSLINFISSLNPAQKRNMKNVHIILHIDVDNYYYPHSWRFALVSKYLSMFRGLETLQLCIEHQLDLYDWTTDTVVSAGAGNYQKLWNAFLKKLGLEPLRALPLKRASVAISNHVRGFGGGSGGRYSDYDFLTDELKIEYAEAIRANLIDPHGGELQQAADAIKKAAEKAEAAENSKRARARKLRIAKEKVEEFQTRATNANQHASQMENAAEKALASFDCKSKEYLQSNTTRFTAAAQKARDKAEKTQSNLQLWQSRLTKRQTLEDKLTKTQDAKMEVSYSDDEPDADSE